MPNHTYLCRTVRTIMKLPASDRAAGTFCALTIASGFADAGYGMTEQPQLKLLIGGLKLTFFFLTMANYIQNMASTRNSIRMKATLSAALTCLIAGLFFHTATTDLRLQPRDPTKSSAGLAALAGAFLGITTLMQLNSKHQLATTALALSSSQSETRTETITIDNVQITSPFTPQKSPKKNEHEAEGLESCYGSA